RRRKLRDQIAWILQIARMIGRFLKHIVFLFIAGVSASAQAPVSASVDTVKNKIGSEFRFTIRAKSDTATRVSFPTGKNFGPMEVIRSYKIDTVADGCTHELI